MAWAPLLLVVLAHGSGSLVQAALTQTPPMSVNPGETVQITCSGGSGSYGWFQQKTAGSAPVTVIYYKSVPIPCHLGRGCTALSNVPLSMATLPIPGVQAEAVAVYYCAGWDTSADQGHGDSQHWGSDTQTHCQPKVSPTIHLFPPSSKELSVQSKATLVCLQGDFYPDAMQVAWTADGGALTSGIETSQPQQQINNQYQASSYLTLSATDWKSHETYTCKVTHETGTIEKVLNRSEC
ncbi:IGL1 protein, partial [Thalassarche chlororhynchos]|nr:IGL1 protein [Thalassarche chlororhynchos]